VAIRVNPRCPPSFVVIGHGMAELEKTEPNFTIIEIAVS
jgi:hypothetical protein